MSQCPKSKNPEACKQKLMNKINKLKGKVQKANAKLAKAATKGKDVQAARQKAKSMGTNVY
jgi:flagellar biosynthesis/type III secretory pathway protein FliH